MIRKLAAALGASALLVLGASTAALANPLPSVSASTSVTHHPDTTSASGPGCTSSVNGPVWAIDTYTSSMTAVNTSGNDWTVSISDSGTFAGFADPANCAYGISHGTFSGTYTVFVVSPTAPVAADLHSNYDGAISTSTMVKDFFNGAATSVTGGDYDFSYQGGNYVQNTDGTKGDVTLDPCTVTIRPIADINGILGASGTVQVQASTNEATPPSNLIYLASGLPHSLTIDHSTGKISGTLTGPTGTSLVTIKVINTAFPQGENREACSATTTFKFTVSLTAPPTPTPTPTGTPGTTGGGSGVPTGAPQTGGGLLPTANPAGDVAGVVLLVIGLALAGVAGRKVSRNH